MKRLFDMVGDLLGAKKPYTHYMEQGSKALGEHAYVEAEKEYLRALEGAEEVRKHDDIAAISLQLGIICERLDKLAVAETYYRKAYQTEEDSEKHAEAAEILVMMGRLYHKMRRMPDAEQVLQYAMSIYQQQFTANHPGIAEAAICLAQFYMDKKSYSEAEKLLMRAIAIEEQEKGSNNVEVAAATKMLAISFDFQDKDEEAEKSFQHAIQAYESCRDSFDKPTAHDACACYHDYARFLLRRGKEQDARPMLKSGLDLADAYPGYLDEADLADKYAAITPN